MATAETTLGSTAPPGYPLASLRRARWGRRAFVGVLGTFVGLGAVGILGVRSASVSATGGGYRLTVTYATVTRPGLASPWSVEIHHEGGFDGPVTLATTAGYFGLFDENGLDPDPVAATYDGERLIWRFEPPDGETLRIDFDARVAPAVQWGLPAATSVLEGGRPVVSVEYRTWVMP